MTLSTPTERMGALPNANIFQKTSDAVVRHLDMPPFFSAHQRLQKRQMQYTTHPATLSTFWETRFWKTPDPDFDLDQGPRLYR